MVVTGLIETRLYGNQALTVKKLQLSFVVIETALDGMKRINYLSSLFSITKRTVWYQVVPFCMQWSQCIFADNYDTSFCFRVFEKRLTQVNCFLFCKKYGFIFLSLVLISRKNRRCWLKDVHRRQKLTTDFLQTFELTILVVTISISRKKKYTYHAFYGIIF